VICSWSENFIFLCLWAREYPSITWKNVKLGSGWATWDLARTGHQTIRKGWFFCVWILDYIEKMVKL